ncbi:hypothetical protein R1flu_000901 [Riccia fluitans]|uniref:Protein DETOXIFICATION n=1 Tax=Riccia fluitans TaxID=41844 RepID=A0ABD1Y1R3_9MARC
MEYDSLTQQVLQSDDRAPSLPIPGAKSRRFSEEKNEDLRTWLTKELWEQFRITGPMILVSLLQFALNLISLVFVGHLGELELSSSQIAVTVAVATGLNVMMGSASALETLCGQAYGAKEYYLTGIFLQRAIFVLTIICIPISFIWWYLGPILTAIGQNPEIAERAQEYTRFLIPTLFAYACLQPLVKFMQTQSAVKAMALLSAITLVIHVSLCYFIIYQWGAGFRGAAIATGISQWINFLFLACYLLLSSNFNKTWTGFSSEAFNDIYPFLKIALPSALLICLQSWCFDTFVIVSGLLPNPKLETSTFSVCLNTVALLSMVPNGFSSAVSTRVSNELGAGLPNAAKAAVRLTVSLGLIEGFIVAIILVSVRNIFPYVFISESDVVDRVSSIVPIMAAIVILDCYQTILGGVARGCGWQHIGAYTDFCAFYFIGLPLGLLLTFYFKIGGYGLWIGLISGFFMQAFLLTCILLTLDWQKLAIQAAERVHGARSLFDGLLPTTTVNEAPLLLK